MSEQPKTEKPKTKNLVTKLCEVVAATEWVPKNGWNDFHKYAFARESDIVDSIRGELSKRNVLILPSIISHTRTEHVNQKGNKTYFTEVNVRWQFTDGDSGETIITEIPGTGEDTGDKGFYKAFTGSEKYMLTKTFLIPTGDDPENEDTSKPEPPRQGREYKLNPVPTSPTSVVNQSPNISETKKTGKIGNVRVWEKGNGWSLSIGEFGGKQGESVWTMDARMAAALAKAQGTVVQAHLRSKKPGSYQVVGYIPVVEQRGTIPTQEEASEPDFDEDIEEALRGSSPETQPEPASQTTDSSDDYLDMGPSSTPTSGQDRATPAPEVEQAWREYVILSFGNSKQSVRDTFHNRKLGDINPTDLDKIEKQWLPTVREQWDQATDAQRLDYQQFEKAISFNKLKKPW
jgi:hypothetical protein